MTDVEAYFKGTFRDKLAMVREEVHFLAKTTPDPMEFIANMAQIQKRFYDEVNSVLTEIRWTAADERFLKYLSPNWFPRYMNDSESFEP